MLITNYNFMGNTLISTIVYFGTRMLRNHPVKSSWKIIIERWSKVHIQWILNIDAKMLTLWPVKITHGAKINRWSSIPHHIHLVSWNEYKFEKANGIHSHTPYLMKKVKHCFRKIVAWNLCYVLIVTRNMEGYLSYNKQIPWFVAHRIKNVLQFFVAIIQLTQFVF